MSDHTLKAINRKELNDGMVAFQFRCCDDAQTDSWVAVNLSLTAAQLTETINHHKAKMAGLHENKQAYRNGTHAVFTVTGDSKVTI
jgi:hypothetical protein